MIIYHIYNLTTLHKYYGTKYIKNTHGNVDITLNIFENYDQFLEYPT